jgi:hypothetical protein
MASLSAVRSTPRDAALLEVVMINRKVAFDDDDEINLKLKLNLLKSIQKFCVFSRKNTIFGGKIAGSIEKTRKKTTTKTEEFIKQSEFREKDFLKK